MKTSDSGFPTNPMESGAMGTGAMTSGEESTPAGPVSGQDHAEFSYIGGELALFQHARNWKAYWSGQIRDSIRGDVLEVGSGIGSNTALLAGLDLDFATWTCMEPDAELLAQSGALPDGPYRTRQGTTGELTENEVFDTLLYIDVLEHIEDDAAEMRRAARHLRPGGRVIVVSPAHQFLFSPFDAAIGHYRRYSLAALAATAPPDLEPVTLRYLDSVGLLASSANRLLLKASMPNQNQILTWDRLMVPVSRWIDALLGWRVGKSVLGIWQKQAAPGQAS